MAEPGQRSDGDDVVEVHFNPPGARRRKSSMQSCDPPASMVRAQRLHQNRMRPAQSNTDCIVHQFFESQLRQQHDETHREEVSQDADAENSATDSAAADQDSESDFSDTGERDAVAKEAAVAAEDLVAGDKALGPGGIRKEGLAFNPVDKNGLRSPPQLECPQDCDGQPDEQAWVGAMRLPRELTPMQSRRNSPPQPSPQGSSVKQTLAIRRGLPGNTYDRTPTSSTLTVPPTTPYKKSPPRHRKQQSAAALVESAASTANPAEVSLHSRHLTKRQLTDMVWGVRELSRRLGSVRIKAHVRSIFVLTKIHDTSLIEHTRTLTHWLLHPDRATRYVVYVEKKLAQHKMFRLSDLRTELRDLHKDAGDTNAASEVAAESHGRLRMWTEVMCREKPETFDFCITLGGDGTVLYAGWLFQRVVPPVVTFSLGSLGFLTKFDFARFEKTLTTAFHEGVVVSLRLRFECTVMRSRARVELIEKLAEEDKVGDVKAGDDDAKADEDEKKEDSTKAREEQIRELLQQRDLVEELVGEECDNHHTHQPDGSFEILNEVVVDRGPNPTMSYTEIFGDNEHFTSVLADGVCVSTPTGSTAYNLAAGGSLCHPDNPVMLVTSICAHALSFRPIILPDTIVLRIGVPYNARTSSWASFDGRDRVQLRPGDYVTISASRYPFASVLSDCGGRSEDWVNSIRGKLGWNTRQKQKAFDS